jgi:hypothetical protein
VDGGCIGDGVLYESHLAIGDSSELFSGRRICNQGDGYLVCQRDWRNQEKTAVFKDWLLEQLKL